MAIPKTFEGRFTRDVRKPMLRHCDHVRFATSNSGRGWAYFFTATHALPNVFLVELRYKESVL